MRLIIKSMILLCMFTAVQAEYVTTLNGFKLWQLKGIEPKSLGKPFRTIKEASYTIEMYKLEPKGLMAFEYLNDFPHNIYSIQISGDVKSMLPFKGLRLGDTKKRVLEVLGKPDEIRPFKEFHVQAYIYDHLNASVEVDDNGILYSIKTSISKDMMSKIDRSKEFDVWFAFEAAIKAKDVAKILALLRPDIEIYQGAKTLTIDKRMSDFQAAPDKAFIEALIGEKQSVLHALKESNPETEMRLSEYVGIGQVHKFYKGSIVREIVLFPYAGQYGIYEIKFYDPKEKK